jgi:hypothetical protein
LAGCVWERGILTRQVQDHVDAVEVFHKKSALP